MIHTLELQGDTHTMIMKVLHFPIFQLIHVLELQCATLTGIPRCCRHWHFKVLYVFEPQGAGKEVTTKQKQKKEEKKEKKKREQMMMMMMKQKNKKQNKRGGGGGGGRQCYGSGRLHYLCFSHTNPIHAIQSKSFHRPVDPERIAQFSPTRPALLGSPAAQLE